jgi:hypothetical protein
MRFITTKTRFIKLKKAVFEKKNFIMRFFQSRDVDFSKKKHRLVSLRLGVN